MNKLLCILFLISPYACTSPAVAAVDLLGEVCTDRVLLSNLDSPVRAKAHRYVEVDGECLLSNEWSPVDAKGYTKEYRDSKQYQNAKWANDNLKSWRVK